MFFKRNIFLIFVIITFLLLVNCKDERISDDTYFGSKVMILGHRGMGTMYKRPGNTYEALTPAIGIGVDGCEIDVQITKDSVLVLYHDPYLTPMTTCSGKVYEMTWQEIKDCKYYGFQNMIFVNNLDELFNRIPNISQYYFSFHCKIDDDVLLFEKYQDQLLRAIKKISEKYRMDDKIFIEGRESFLIAAQKNGLNNKLFLAGSVDDSTIELALQNKFFGICTNMRFINVDADNAHNKGLYIMAYTPHNFSDNMELINKKVDIIQTDDPISILKYFKRYNYEYIIP